MYREMRRKKQQLSREESAAILRDCTSGTLAVLGDGGYPYAVPLSYVYDEQADKIYFHSAKAGHKLDAIRRTDKASFCVVSQDKVIPERFTTHFRSVIVFGRVRLIEEGEERLSAIQKLAARYSPRESPETIQKEISSSSQFLMIELSIEHMTGKESIELTRARKKGDQ